MIYENVQSYDKTKDETIEICLNCTKKHCNGDCKFNKTKRNKSKDKKV